MSTTLRVSPRRLPQLDPSFLPALLWNREFEAKVEREGGIALGIALEGGAGAVSVHRTRILAGTDKNSRSLNERYAERLLKFLLWQKGGWRVIIGGCEALAKGLQTIYAPAGRRAFDFQFMGEKLFGKTMRIETAPLEALPEERESAVDLGGHLDGCRIGFDLGGSDRKAAALIDGQVVFSEEIPWDPYFQKDPAYHFEGIRDSLRRAAAHLPRVDAIGGSAAGVYVNNEVRAGSLFRGVSGEDFANSVRRIFFRVMEIEGWSNIPWQVVNDGEVTALAGSMALEAPAVLGISMGTSLASGYVDPQGRIRPWLNELAFAPIDYRADAPADEWSGDIGCGAQFFSQQGVGRLVPRSGVDLPNGMPLPEQLASIQELLAQGDERAAGIYNTLGTCFGYAVAHYAGHYDLKHLLLLGRVMSGPGGGLLIEKAQAVLAEEFPDLARRLHITTPSEKDKRHGQAIAAASLPALH
ncbi:MAG TPA: ROK family protein [Verrucomicrobiales bacterium]|nr:ROK family protein [Verrucomicrobiales bacterium]